MHVLNHTYARMAFWFKSRCTFWGEVSRKNVFSYLGQQHLVFPFSVTMWVTCGALAFGRYYHKQHLWVASHLWQRGTFQKTLAACPPLLNKPHDIYNRVDVLKKNWERSVVSWCRLVTLCLLHPLPAALLEVRSQSSGTDSPFLPGFNGVDRGAPTCGESGI